MNKQKSVSRREFIGGTLTATVAASLLEAKKVLAEDKPAETNAPAKTEIKRKIKLGFIGCGQRGSWLAKLFKEHGGYEIHAMADYFPEVADKAADSLGVDKARRFSGLGAYKRLLGSGVEAVVVANIPRFHAEHAYAAVEAGCHVYAAKPVAIDVPRALKVQAAGKLATEKKLVYLVDYQIPTDPINIEVAKRIHEGGLGQLMHAQSVGFSETWPDPANRDPENLLRQSNWLTAIPLSGDFIVEYSIHAIDAVLWAAKSRPVRAYGLTRRCRPNAHGDGREVYLVNYEFEDGLVWTHRCQALRNNQGWPIGSEIYGSNASAQINYFGKSFVRGGKKHYGGGEVESLYDNGAKRNIVTFYKLVMEGQCENLSVQRAVDGALTGVLGRESAARHKELTMAELIAENKELEFDTKGLKV